MKRHAVTSRQDHSRPSAERMMPRQGWSRRSGRDFRMVGGKENQVVRGLIVGLPLALALWTVLALIIWRTF